MENPDFQALTPVEKIYYWLLLSEFNLRECQPFYMADLWAACTVGVGVEKIRKARRAFTRKGWLKTRPGFQSRGKNLATTYLHVEWAKTPEQGWGDWFAQMHRHAFDAMLDRIRNKIFDHADVVVYLYLCYLKNLYDFEGDGDFFVAKNQLYKTTNILHASARVERLYQHFEFSGGNRLFEYEDKCHRLSFKKWSTFADPGENEGNRKIAERYKEEIKEKINRLRMGKKHTEKITSSSDLLILYIQTVNPLKSPGHKQREWLSELGKQHGVVKVAKKIIKFSRVNNRTPFRAFKSWWSQNC